MVRPLRLVVALCLVAPACAEDDLRSLPEAPPVLPQCLDGTVVTSLSLCPTGAISGRVCDRAHGIWLEGVTATVTAGNEEYADVTDGNGSFLLQDLPPGAYYVYLTADGYDNVLPAQVAAGQVTTVGATECLVPPGHLRGRVCDEEQGLWLGGATVSVDDSAGTSATTDEFGNFMFFSLPARDYVVTITHSSGYTATRNATVRSQEITDLGPSDCSGAGGTVSGRICGGDGYWLSGATVYVDLGGSNRRETTTDGQGHYTLTGVPDGTHTVHIERGSFSTEFQVTVTGGQDVVVPDPVCIPPTQRIMVITGVYDSVEDVLTDLGYRIRNRYTDSRSPTPVDSGGSVDVLDGETTSFWINDFLGDPAWMDDYDILFFNCGIYDADLGAGGMAVTRAIANLRLYVEGGKSLYASDWASELVRLTFPGRINFLGDDNQFGSARVGMANNTQSAAVIDSGLRASLGRNSLTINLNLPQWVVVDRGGIQPSDLRVLVIANVEYATDPFGFDTDTVTDSPLVVRFDYGNGRVLYTSAHNEGQNTSDLEAVLNYIVFEL
jgi:hypothetical protein